MKRILKKLISAFLVAVILLTAAPLTSFDSFAANGIEMRLEKLKRDFPDGYYWNHQVKSNSDKLESILNNWMKSMLTTLQKLLAPTMIQQRLSVVRTAIILTAVISVTALRLCSFTKFSV